MGVEEKELRGGDIRAVEVENEDYEKANFKKKFFRKQGPLRNYLHSGDAAGIN
jgi:hypothetical protein